MIPFEKLLRHPPLFSKQHEALTGTIKHQQTAFDVNMNGQTSSAVLDIWGNILVMLGVS